MSIEYVTQGRTAEDRRQRIGRQITDAFVTSLQIGDKRARYEAVIEHELGKLTRDHAIIKAARDHARAVLTKYDNTQEGLDQAKSAAAQAAAKVTPRVAKVVEKSLGDGSSGTGEDREKIRDLADRITNGQPEPGGTRDRARQAARAAGRPRGPAEPADPERAARLRELTEPNLARRREMRQERNGEW